MASSTHLSARVGTTPQAGQIDGWTLEEHGAVTSTNLVAAKLPAWHAVRADTQTAGRGRFQRAWISDAGGLWLSAVLPLSPRWGRILPLMTGMAVCQVLSGIGVAALRLRWPNDILIGKRKLAGLLIDQFTTGLAVAGIGVNVFNQPERIDGQLKGETTRLADEIDQPPSLTELTRMILGSLKETHTKIELESPDCWLPQLNRLWNAPRPVHLELDTANLTGTFQGVDAAGRLILSTTDHETRLYEPHEVRLLRDI